MKASFKTLSVLALAMLIFVSSTIAQQLETVQVDITKLSQQELMVYQKLKLKQNQAAAAISVTLDKLVENPDKYAQIGKSFGTAFKECWGTVSNDAERFAQSSAGKWAMFLVAWKIAGQDGVQLVEKAVQYFVGIPLLFFGSIFFVYIFRRNCVSQPELVSKTKLLGFITYRSEYKGTSEAIHADVAIVYGTCYIVFIGVCTAIMFI